jgi:DNA-binding GntR family transcriptional regulator
MHELAARLATPLLTDEDLARLQAANTRFADCLQRQDLPGAIEADDDFHGVFVTRSGNAVIPEVLERVVPVLRRVERMRFASIAGRSTVAPHATIIEHARAGEAEAAAQVSLENWLSLRYTFEH